MKLLIVFLSSFILTACCFPSKPNNGENVVISHQYTSKKIPSELLEIPEVVPLPNINGTQKDISLWIIENEKRTRVMENQLIKIKEYNKE